GCTVHFRRHVIVLCDLLLNRQLVVTLVFLFATDVSNPGFLVFIDVKDSFSWHSCSLHLVRRQSSVYLLLFRRLRRARAKSRCCEQGCCIRRTHSATARHKERRNSDSKAEDDFCITFF